MNCDAQLLDEGFTYECELPEHAVSVAHAAGIRFDSRRQGPMFGLLRWSLLPDAIDGLREPVLSPVSEDRATFDAMAMGAVEQLNAEWADRYVDVRDAIELADTRTGVVSEKDGVVEVYSLKAADWNRVVAVARGHVSQKARRSLDAYRQRVFRRAQR